MVFIKHLAFPSSVLKSTGSAGLICGTEEEKMWKCENGNGWMLVSGKQKRMK